MTKHRLCLLLGLLALLAACSGGASPSPTSSAPPGATPGPSATPSPTIGGSLTLAEMKLAMIDRFGALWYCDPDYYPVARADEIDSARQRWPEVMADAEAFAAITARQALDPGGDFSDDEKLAVYRAWKVLNAIALDPIGNDIYRFDYLAEPAVGGGGGERTAGTISTSGEIVVEGEAPATAPMCPICLARGTLIETPLGPVAVEDFGIGDPIWTLDARGARVPATVIALGSTAAPADHHVVRLVLADGRRVTASPGHPLADGRSLGNLRAGDALGGSVVVSTDLVAYAIARTYDIAVGGPTGIYLVDGIALGSTLRP